MTPTIEPREPIDPAPSPIKDSYRLNRRTVTGALALGTVTVGAGTAGAATARASFGSDFRRRRLAFEIACLADTLRFNERGNPANDADVRSAFVVEGLIYPDGTIKGDGFIPREEGSIGRWVCRGSFLISESRQEPHTAQNATLYFGAITKDSPFPRSSLHSVGISGTDDRTLTAWRAVVGGTGEHSGARGEVGERQIATNTTIFPGSNDVGPCWRFDFDLWVPE